jgi:hypothetical protein
VPPVAPFTTTCTGATAGDLLQGAIVTVRFPLRGGGTQDVTGTVTGPGAAAPVAAPAGAVVPVLPLLPPPPPFLLPPPPPPLVPLPPAAAAAPLGAGPAPEVPVIPEAPGLALVGLGLGGLALLRALAARATPSRRRPD